MALDLTLESTKDYISQRVDEAVKYDDKHAAQEVLRIFRAELTAQEDKVMAAPGLYEAYKQAWVTAQFILLPSLAEDDFLDLLREHLIEGLRIADYDFVDKIGLRISFMRLEAEQIALMEQVLEILRKNTGTLGTQNIQVSGRTALPTVQNWLLDYDSYPSQSAQKSDYEQISFVSKSPNASLLSGEDKKVLLSILDCYDSLRNYLAYYRSLPDATESYVNDPANWYQFYPGVNVVDTIEEDENSDTAVQPQPAAPTLPAAENSIVEEQISVAPALVEYSSESEAKPESIIVEDKPEPVVRPVRTAGPSATSMPPQPQNYIVEDDSFEKAQEPAKSLQESSIAEEIKRNLSGSSIKAAPAPLNIQDFLNERHNNKGDSRGGLVFDQAAKPAATPTPKPVIPEPAAKASAPPANLPVAETLKPANPAPTPPLVVPEPAPKAPVASAVTENPQSDIAKKLEELRKRKKS